MTIQQLEDHTGQSRYLCHARRPEKESCWRRTRGFEYAGEDTGPCEPATTFPSACNSDLSTRSNILPGTYLLIPMSACQMSHQSYRRSTSLLGGRSDHRNQRKCLAGYPSTKIAFWRCTTSRTDRKVKSAAIFSSDSCLTKSLLSTCC